MSGAESCTEKDFMEKQLNFKKPRGLNRLSVTWLILTVALIVCLQGILFAVLSGSEVNWDIHLDTVSGDPGVMKGVTLSGTVVDDSSFVLGFSIKDGVSSQKLDRREETIRKMNMQNTVNDWWHLTAGRTQYEMNFMGGAGNLEIIRRIYGAGYFNESYSVIEMKTGYSGGTAEKSQQQKAAEEAIASASGQTGVSADDEEQPSYSSTNQGSGTESISDSITVNVGLQTPVMQELDGKLYFIIPKVRGCSGNSGLYIADSFGETVPGAGCTKLTDIPLNGGDNEMILLAKVSGNLCLVRYDNRGLALQPFDPARQAFEPETLDTSVNPNTNGILHVFANGNYLSIVLWTEKEYEINTYEVSDRIRKQGKLSADSEKTLSRYIERICFVNDRWYVLTKQIVWKNTETQYLNVNPPPDEVISLSVFDTEGRGVYRGELDTCSGDDAIRYRKYNDRLIEAGGGGSAPYRRILSVGLDESGS